MQPNITLKSMIKYKMHHMQFLFVLPIFVVFLFEYDFFAGIFLRGFSIGPGRCQKETHVLN